MIRSKVTRVSEYDHAVNVRIDVEIQSTKEMFLPEIASILKTCYERQPAETVGAIEYFMKEVLDNDLDNIRGQHG